MQYSVLYGRTLAQTQVFQRRVTVAQANIVLIKLYISITNISRTHFILNSIIQQVVACINGFTVVFFSSENQSEIKNAHVAVFLVGRILHLLGHAVILSRLFRFAYLSAHCGHIGKNLVLIGPVAIFMTRFIAFLVIRQTFGIVLEHTIDTCYVVIEVPYLPSVLTCAVDAQSAEIGRESTCVVAFHIENIAFLQICHCALLLVFVGEFVVHAVARHHVIHQGCVGMSGIEIMFCLLHYIVYRGVRCLFDQSHIVFGQHAGTGA